MYVTRHLTQNTCSGNMIRYPEAVHNSRHDREYLLSAV